LAAAAERGYHRSQLAFAGLAIIDFIKFAANGVLTMRKILTIIIFVLALAFIANHYKIVSIPFLDNLTLDNRDRFIGGSKNALEKNFND
jgi:uncharacterized membrane protein